MTDIEGAPSGPPERYPCPGLPSLTFAQNPGLPDTCPEPDCLPREQRMSAEQGDRHRKLYESTKAAAGLLENLKNRCRTAGQHACDTINLALAACARNSLPLINGRPFGAAHDPASACTLVISRLPASTTLYTGLRDRNSQPLPRRGAAAIPNNSGGPVYSDRADAHAALKAALLATAALLDPPLAECYVIRSFTLEDMELRLVSVWGNHLLVWVAEVSIFNDVIFALLAQLDLSTSPLSRQAIFQRTGKAAVSNASELELVAGSPAYAIKPPSISPGLRAASEIRVFIVSNTAGQAVGDSATRLQRSFRHFAAETLTKDAKTYMREHPGVGFYDAVDRLPAASWAAALDVAEVRSFPSSGPAGSAAAAVITGHSMGFVRMLAAGRDADMRFQDGTNLLLVCKTGQSPLWGVAVSGFPRMPSPASLDRIAEAVRRTHAAGHAFSTAMLKKADQQGAEDSPRPQALLRSISGRDAVLFTDQPIQHAAQYFYSVSGTALPAAGGELQGGQLVFGFGAPEGVISFNVGLISSKEKGGDAAPGGRHYTFETAAGSGILGYSGGLLAGPYAGIVNGMERCLVVMHAANSGQSIKTTMTGPRGALSLKVVSETAKPLMPLFCKRAVRAVPAVEAAAPAAPTSSPVAAGSMDFLDSWAVPPSPPPADAPEGGLNPAATAAGASGSRDTVDDGHLEDAGDQIASRKDDEGQTEGMDLDTRPQDGDSPGTAARKLKKRRGNREDAPPPPAPQT